MRLRSSLFISVLLLFVAPYVKPIFAMTAPQFPVCALPQGTIIASYDNGIHGIVGDPNTHEGTDVVYKINDAMVMQCFCPPDSKGIQTNWLNAKGMTPQEITDLENQGWIKVPDGSLWGLSADPYLAQNDVFSCALSSPAIGGGSNDTSNTNGTTVASNTSTESNQTGEVLGLAATGDSVLVWASFFLAVISFTFYRRFQKSS